MMTFQQFAKKIEMVPAATGWYLADLGEARGKQDLFTKQAPQKLKSLKEHALIESAVSSNRIEGVEIDQKRIGTVIFGKSLLHDRSEEEIRGYRNALKWIHEKGKKIDLSVATILELHRLTRGEIWDAGKLKEKDGDIVEKFPEGGQRIRFRTVPAAKTPQYMETLIQSWHECIKERWVHPLIALAAFNLDFLCIHPFRDGNGRVSRLLLLLQLYHLGYEAGRYVSLERVIEQNKERYYETLEASSHNWHDGKHNPWHYINFILFVTKAVYQEFEERVGALATPRGAKTELLLSAIDQAVGPFRVADLQQKCFGVSLDMIRVTLKKLRQEEKVRCLGRGQHAQWEKTSKWELGNT
jgi:Fic family protein